MANDYIEMLKERDTAKPLEKVMWAVGSDPLPACPTCGEMLIIVERDHFCRNCGQRLDIENWAFK